MKLRCIPFLLFAVFFPLVTGMTNVYGAESSSRPHSNSPIQITSDRLDAYDNEALVLFSGNVVATQDDAVICADELYLYYDKSDAGEKSISPGATSGGKIEKIELKGNVTVEKGERVVTGDRAVFHNADQTVVMTGHAVMREGNNMITGDKITVFLKENRGMVQSSGGKKRVNAVIYPESDVLPTGESPRQAD